MTTETTDKKLSPFMTRGITGIIFATVVLIILGFGGGAFAIMVTAGAAVCTFEWARMVTTGQSSPKMLIWLSSMAAAVGVASAVLLGHPVAVLCVLLALCFLVFAVNVAQQRPPATMLVFGIIYIGFAMAMLIWLRQGTTGQGLYNVMTLLLAVWASDVFAYLSGRAIGGPKLAPSISPNKTWAGLMGGALGAAAVATLLTSSTVQFHLGGFALEGYGAVEYAIMGAVLGVCGQVGDLFISIFKRRYGLKDTGAILPGHGGLLDRLDALLFDALLFGSFVMFYAG